MVAVRRPDGLTDDLVRLAAALESLDLRGARVLGQDTEAERDQLVSTVRSYLVPRIENPEAPFLVVVAGPTGSGKSTLVNSLSGIDLSATGPIRPTTTAPVVLARIPGDGGFVDIGGIECEVVGGGAPILEHLSLVDTPDFDSTATRHRAIAENIVDHADVVVFVTSALRYADDVPWEVLRRARSRGAVVIPVINRVGPNSGAAVYDFKRKLGDAGFEDDPVRIPEHHLGDSSYRVPSLAVSELRRRLLWVAKDRENHQKLVVNRVLNATTDRVRQLISAATKLAAELDVVESEMTNGLAVSAALPQRNRPWAAFPVPPMPAHRLRAWKRRAQPSASELAVWEKSVRAGVVAEAETMLLTALATHGGPVRILNPSASATATHDARAMLATAVNGWFSGARTALESSACPRLATVTLVSSVLTRVDAVAVEAVLGRDHAALVTKHRAALNGRLGVVFDHFGQRLAEVWRLSVGDPAVDDLEDRLASVAAAYQFADA